MNVPEEERRDAGKLGELVSKKLKEIMDLQADINALLRDKRNRPVHPFLARAVGCEGLLIPSWWSMDHGTGGGCGLGTDLGAADW